MIDIEFLQAIQHKMCRNGNIESCDCIAYKLDEPDGFVTQLNFRPNSLNKVDYVTRSGHVFQLIEMTDLEDSIRDCKIDLDANLKIAEMKKGERLTATDRSKIQKKTLIPITSEIKNKFFGSLAVIERLYRRRNVPDIDPEFKFLLVVKNATEVKMLDEIKKRISGMATEVQVCNTKDISSFILSETNSE